ncbi:BREX-2 system phosphatase PglZ [Yinghuangia sp. YIM S10712]|uniref:BREX-2 system phosphatase PglZ n=1 Tax=Yinghuangia sp. YIM S10712 TaxID=3436930 RepID=UPI003F530C76
MSITASTSAMRLSTATVTQYLASKTTTGVPSGRRIVVLLRAEPVWHGPEEVAWSDGRARVTVAPSVLGVHEHVLRHLSSVQGPEILVVLTDREEAELGPDLLAKVHRQRVSSVNVWDVVREAFGATETDRRLFTENWAAEALADAQTGKDWPQLAGGMLSRNTALSALAKRRLGIGRTGRDGDDESVLVDGDGLDVHTLLRWSSARGGVERFLALRSPEREGLARFLGEADQCGDTGKILFSLVTAEHGSDAVAFGLVCAALWVHAAEDTEREDYQARGRAERWLGEEPPARDRELDALMAKFGSACEEFVAAEIAQGQSRGDEFDLPAAAARRMTGIVLDRAAVLARQFGAEGAARRSPLLVAGLEARFEAVGVALASGDPEPIASAVAALADHRLATSRESRVRIERVRMAQRLVRWPARGPGAGADTVAASVAAHVAENGWVDLALEHIEAGGDTDPVLRSAYASIVRDVRARRRVIDEDFARGLAAWTADGRGPGTMVTVESFLSTVVKPMVADTKRAMLLIVIDGMSAAIAAELGEELREHWAEYDPLPDATDPPRRRAMAAALPTTTAVSRTSLFAGRLMTGGQADEKRLFAAQPFWGPRKAAVFHKDDLRGKDAEPFGPELLAALDDDGTHVAVVLNVIDDRLAKEQKIGDGSWHLAEIAGLTQLLQYAAQLGRVVIITSDHGHVVDRDGRRVDAPPGTTADRYRPAGGRPPGDTEIALAGARVVAPEHRNSIVALWDRDSRYTSKKAGYHGGVSPAEVAVPILAFLPFGATPPKGWRELGTQQPEWWQLSLRDGRGGASPGPTAAGTSRPAPSAPAKTAARQTRFQTEIAQTHDSLFEISLAAAGTGALLEPVVAAPHEALVDELLRSETFEAQVQLLARRPDRDRVRQAVLALLDAGGTLPTTALAQRVKWPATRSVESFAAVLRQLLNRDGEQVLEALPDGRTLRLDVGLLRLQFGLRG